MATPSRETFFPPPDCSIKLNNDDHYAGDSTFRLTRDAGDGFNLPPIVPPSTFDATAFQGPSSFVNPAPNFNQYQYQDPFGSVPNGGAAPRRGSFTDLLPHGHTLPLPISAASPSSRRRMSDSMSSNIPVPNSGPDDIQTDSDPDFRSSGPSSRMSLPPRSVTKVPDPADDPMITVTSMGDFHGIPTNIHTPTPPGAQDTSARRNKQYVLPDGSVVSGKGLGRGRPGIKRGPRNPKHQIVDNASPQTPSINETDPASCPSVAPRQKRKSDASNPSIGQIRASTIESATTASRDSSEEYNPTATHTRSGRHIQKPVSLTRNLAASASPSGILSRANSTTNASPSTIKTHPKIKRRVYRGREQFALCEHCLRGHGPPGNVIVFCDACNKCWHQRCHVPSIPKQTVVDSKAEWFCVDCDRILHGGKKSKKPQGKANSQAVAVARAVINAPLVYSGPRIGGRLLQPNQRLAYLKTLPKEDLISLLLQASDLAPDLPLFETLVPTPQPPIVPQAQFTSTYVTPVSKPPVFGNAEPGEEAVDEGYDGYYDEHAALYPKPGNGVQLPPESEDLHMLLEGRDSKTFSHWVRGMGGNDFSGTGNITRGVY